MKKFFTTQVLCSIFTLVLIFSLSSLFAQNDTMYIWKSGAVINKQSVKTTDVDSMTFYRPTPYNINIACVNIPAGTFTMGSPVGEPNRIVDEIERQVTLSAFRMSKYEITNSQYAAFLNAKGIGSDGKYAAGAYPLEPLIYASTINDWSLHYTNNQWVPVVGYENYPVFHVTWYGAVEFATYIGGKLPTDAQWEYACRGNTNTAFNTGNCLSNTQANYDWADPQTNCTNNITTFPAKTKAVGTYAANAFGLYDMHGNVNEWCSDWLGSTSASAQTNPTGPTTGTYRVFRGGCWGTPAMICRSAYRNSSTPYSSNNLYNVGFRIVLVP
ncbi:MAG: formylglycine-generating enzyme family protein [Bacteroidota bacterium]